MTEGVEIAFKGHVSFLGCQARASSPLAAVHELQGDSGGAGKGSMFLGNMRWRVQQRACSRQRERRVVRCGACARRKGNKSRSIRCGTVPRVNRCRKAVKRCDHSAEIAERLFMATLLDGAGFLRVNTCRSHCTLYTGLVRRSKATCVSTFVQQGCLSETAIPNGAGATSRPAAPAMLKEEPEPCASC
jgi:hypothetical protein